VTLPEIEAALLAGLGERKRAKTLKKLRKNLTQMQGSEAAAAAAAEAADDAAERTAGDGVGDGEESSCVGEADLGGTAAGIYADDSVAAAGAAAGAAGAAAGAAGAGAAANSSSGSTVQLEDVLAVRRRPEEQGHMWHGQQVGDKGVQRGERGQRGWTTCEMVTHGRNWWCARPLGVLKQAETVML
jgi:hypothetical protein